VDTIQQEIEAKASNAPRVTPADLEAEIVSTHYFTAENGVAAAAGLCMPSPPQLKLLTFCVLVLRNGFTATGESACVSPENFNAEIGRKVARENAIEKLWPLLGFRLADQLQLDRDRARWPSNPQNPPRPAGHHPYG
jgi:hypothetical protein